MKTCINKTIKSIIMFIVLFAGAILIGILDSKKQDKELKKILDSHPLFKKYLKDAEDSSFDMVSKKINDKILKRYNNTPNKHDDLSGGFIWTNKKPTEYYTKIAQFDFSEISKEFKNTECYEDHYGSFRIPKDSENSKEIYKECRNRYTIAKNKIKELQNEIKESKDGDLIYLSISEYINPDDNAIFQEFSDEYAICYSTIILHIRIKNIDKIEDRETVKNTLSEIKESFISDNLNYDLSILDESYINEAFLSKEERHERHNKLLDLEDSYDKKYNGFCLAVSRYSIEQLESMLDKKNSELKDAKETLRKTHERDDRLELKLKIDYLENVCNKCKAQIKKKKSYK